MSKSGQAQGRTAAGTVDFWPVGLAAPLMTILGREIEISA